jgi:hypothetical protein
MVYIYLLKESPCNFSILLLNNNLLFFRKTNYIVKGVEFTTDEVSELNILLSDERDFVNGSYKTYLSKSSKMSTYKF